MNYKKYLIIATVASMLIFPEYIFPILIGIFILIIFIIFIADIILDVYIIAVLLLKDFKKK